MSSAEVLAEFDALGGRVSQHKRFRIEVESFLRRANVRPTQFGKDAVNDPNFVRNLRSGRSPSLSTVDRVLAFIRKSEERAA